MASHRCGRAVRELFGAAGSLAGRPTCTVSLSLLGRREAENSPLPERLFMNTAKIIPFRFESREVVPLSLMISFGLLQLMFVARWKSLILRAL